MQIKPQDKDSRSSASAESADQHTNADAACTAEAQRIQDWAQPDFVNSRHQLQRDPSFAKYRLGNVK